MDWIFGIQRAIDEMETQLCGETDFELIAGKNVCFCREMTVDFFGVKIDKIY